MAATLSPLADQAHAATSSEAAHHPRLLELFSSEQLPRRPRCTNDPEAFGTYVRPLEVALGHRYIQHNRPGKVTYLVFDVDRPGAAYAWMDAGLVPPTWACINPINAHAHLVYALEAPVVTSNDECQRPARYVSAIVEAFTQKLKADRNYNGGLTKNPLHPAWRTEVLSGCAYSLSELHEYVDLTGVFRRRRSTEGTLGRNVSLFDDVRHWAYPKVLSARLGSLTLDDWHREVLAEAHARNQFTDASPLPHREVDHVAKSIARWTWRRYTGCGPANAELSAQQARRGKLKGARKRSEGLRLLGEGRCVADIAVELEVTERTVFNWMKRQRQEMP